MIDARCPKCGSTDYGWDVTTLSDPSDLDRIFKDCEYWCRECSYHETWRSTDSNDEKDQHLDHWYRSAQPPISSEPAAKHLNRCPENNELRSQIIARLGDDTPRREYARWLREQAAEISEHGLGSFPELTQAWRDVHDPIEQAQASALRAAWFVDAQLDVAEALRRDPLADLAHMLVWNNRQESLTTLRAGRVGVSVIDDGLAQLIEDGVILERSFYRGFVEHVTMSARTFLDHVDEVYSLAPIRHLTLVHYTGLLRELAKSPHLDRILSLKLPVHAPHAPYASASDLTDDDVELLVSGGHLRQLRWLSLEDADQLTARTLETLAKSAALPELSYVGMSSYKITTYANGRVSRDHRGDRVADLIAKAGKSVGNAPFIHARQYYAFGAPRKMSRGDHDIDREVVCEHPIALRADVHARAGQPVGAT